MLLKVTRIKEISMVFVVIYDCSNYFVPDVIEGDSFHDLIASFMKLKAKNNSTIVMLVCAIGMILIMLSTYK